MGLNLLLLFCFFLIKRTGIDEIVETVWDVQRPKHTPTYPMHLLTNEELVTQHLLHALFYGEDDDSRARQTLQPTQVTSSGWSPTLFREVRKVPEGNANHEAEKPPSKRPRVHKPLAQEAASCLRREHTTIGSE